MQTDLEGLGDAMPLSESAAPGTATNALVGSGADDQSIVAPAWLQPSG